MYVSGWCVGVMGVFVFREMGKENNTDIFSQPSRHHCMVKECGFSQTLFFSVVCKYFWVSQFSVRHLLLGPYLAVIAEKRSLVCTHTH